MLPEEKKEEIRKKKRETYHMNKRSMIGSECISSFEIGSTSQQYFVNDDRVPKRKRTGIDSTEKLHSNKRLEISIPVAADILPSPSCCKYCGAKLFYHESQNLCCCDGKILLTSNEIPDKLYDLYVSTSRESIEFHKYVRTYNNTFAFTSFGVKYDKSLCKRNKGIYTFRVQGQVYHYINDLLPLNANPCYLQLYFYDTEHEIQHRLNLSEKLDICILDQLIEILNLNPYCCFFRSLKDIPNLEDHEVIIRSDACLDQRVFNAPTAPQVAAIWIQNDESADFRERDIKIFSHSGHSKKVKYYYECYDPLQYPLLFPHGDTGWHEGIKKIDRKRAGVFCEDDLIHITHRLISAEDLVREEETVREKARKQRDTVSCREYYSYKLQIRADEKSILIHSRRLLQQYAVDIVALGENRGSKVGKRIVLPSSFIGGPRDMRRRYTDAMALVQRFGKPDIFLTMTCNPNWPEIKKELFPGEQPQDRPDLIARIFKAKIEQLKT